MHPAQLRTRIRELAEPTIRRLGLDLVAVEMIGGRRRPILRLSIDRDVIAGTTDPDQLVGVGADDCALVSVRLGPVFDAEDPMPGAWELEVSSPGIERPVQRLSDFARFAGFRVRIRMEEGLARRRWSGRLVRVDGDDVILEVDGVEHTLSFPSIDAAHLMLDIDEYQKLAHGLPPIPSAEPAAHGAGEIPAEEAP